jgi:hypothetical protein
MEQDQTELQKNIAEAYLRLPENLQAAFSSMEWLEKLNEISKRYRLSEENNHTLGTETTLVLLGLVHPDEYEATLRTELKISPDGVEKIIKEINTEVLAAFRSDLTQTYEANIDTKLDERFSKLPTAVKKAVVTANYHGKIYEIAEMHRLSVEETGNLEEAVTNAIVGNIPTDALEDTLRFKLHLPVEKAAEIVKEVNEKILKDIRRKIMTSYSRPKEHNLNEEEEIILNQAGISLGSAKPSSTRQSKIETEAPEIKPGAETNTAIMVGEPELTAGSTKISDIHPLVAEKMNSAVQNPAVKTEHKLENLPKNGESSGVSYKKYEDPYREKPQ